MIASIPWLQPSWIEFWLLKVCFQIFDLFHPFKKAIINLYTVTSFCILISRHDHVLSFLAFTPRPISSRATTNAFVIFFYTVHSLPPSILTSAQTKSCCVPFDFKPSWPFRKVNSGALFASCFKTNSRTAVLCRTTPGVDGWEWKQTAASLFKMLLLCALNCNAMSATYCSGNMRESNRHLLLCCNISQGPDVCFRCISLDTTKQETKRAVKLSSSKLLIS